MSLLPFVPYLPCHPPRRRLDGPAAQPAKPPTLPPAKPPTLPPAELDALRQRAQAVALRAAREALLRRRQQAAAATAVAVLPAALPSAAAVAPVARGHVGQAPMLPGQGGGGDPDGAAQPAAQGATAAHPAAHTSPMELDQAAGAHQAGSCGTCMPTSAAESVPQGPAAVATEMDIPSGGGGCVGGPGPAATAPGVQPASQHARHTPPAAPVGRPLNDAALLAARWELGVEPHVL